MAYWRMYNTSQDQVLKRVKIQGHMYQEAYRCKNLVAVKRAFKSKVYINVLVLICYHSIVTPYSLGLVFCIIYEKV